MFLDPVTAFGIVTSAIAHRSGLRREREHGKGTGLPGSGGDGAESALPAFESTLQTFYQWRFGKAIGDMDNPVITRLYLASASQFQHARLARGKQLGGVARAFYGQTPFPKHVWACELYDRDGYEDRRAFGEIVMDATAENADRAPGQWGFDGVILLNYAGYFAAFGRDRRPLGAARHGGAVQGPDNGKQGFNDADPVFVKSEVEEPYLRPYDTSASVF
jgi:hypothetical protein